MKKKKKVLVKVVDFPNFVFEQHFFPQTTVSSQKICSWDPIFENLGGTYQPKILSTTSPGKNIWPSQLHHSHPIAFLCRSVNSHTLSMSLTPGHYLSCSHTKHVILLHRNDAKYPAKHVNSPTSTKNILPSTQNLLHQGKSLHKVSFFFFLLVTFSESWNCYTIWWTQQT